mmetsp:Transcript_15782/g.47724  ORF Transcript_15782/g.47724 Transcript_15782/m.47724 type:complete len:203 (+) Transcript_15782:827-1435(+)
MKGEGGVVATVPGRALGLGPHEFEDEFGADAEGVVVLEDDAQGGDDALVVGAGEAAVQDRGEAGLVLPRFVGGAFGVVSSLGVPLGELGDHGVEGGGVLVVARSEGGGEVEGVFVVEGAARAEHEIQKSDFAVAVFVDFPHELVEALTGVDAVADAVVALAERLEEAESQELLARKFLIAFAVDRLEELSRRDDVRRVDFLR